MGFEQESAVEEPKTKEGLIDELVEKLAASQGSERTLAIVGFMAEATMSNMREPGVLAGESEVSLPSRDRIMKSQAEGISLLRIEAALEKVANDEAGIREVLEKAWNGEY